MFLKLLLGVVNSLISFILEIDGFTSLLILLLGGLGILNHLIDFRIRETTGRSNGDVGSLAS